jgi:hypothetical protein
LSQATKQVTWKVTVQEASESPASFADTLSAAICAVTSASGPTNFSLDWTVIIRYNQYKLGSTGRFLVSSFLVEVPNDPTQWFSNPCFVDVFDAFTDNAAE